MKQEISTMVEELVSSMQADRPQDVPNSEAQGNTYATQFRVHRKHSRIKRFFAAAAALAAFATTYALILPAITLEERFDYGMPAVNKAVTEGMPASIAADMASVELTGNYADDLVAIAQTQVGYEESTEDVLIEGDGPAKGRTPYGAWYGDPYADWSSIFVSFCLENAGITSDRVPYEADAERWIEVLSDNSPSIYKSVGEYMPLKGDLIFFKDEKGGDANSSKPAFKAGVVTKVEDSPAYQVTSKKLVEFIAGDIDNSVCTITYSEDDPQIVGYAALPVNPAAPVSPADPANPAAPADPADPTAATDPADPADPTTTDPQQLLTTQGDPSPERGSLEYWQALFVQAGAENYLDTLDEETVAEYNQDPLFADKTDEERVAFIQSMVGNFLLRPLADSGDQVWVKYSSLRDPKICYIRNNKASSWYFPTSGITSYARVERVVFETPVKFGDNHKFWNFKSLQAIGNIENIENMDTSGRQNFDHMFGNCTSLTDLSGISGLDTSSAIYMRHMFANCTSLTDLSGLAGLDTSSAKYMRSMFANCTSLTDVSGLANWDTSSVTHMGPEVGGAQNTGMFANCTSLTDVSGLANWDTSSVVNMEEMFHGCNSLTDITPLANWDTSSLVAANGLFPPYLQYADLSNWNLDRVKSFINIPSSIQRIVTQRGSKVLYSSVPLMNEAGTVYYGYEAPPGNLVLVPYDSRVFNDLSDCMVLMTKTLDGKSENLPTFGFKVYNEDNTPVDMPTIYSDAFGNIKFDATNLPTGRYYVKEISDQGEIEADPNLEYYPNIDYDTSQQWFEKVEENVDLKAALEDPNNTINIDVYSMTITRPNGEIIATSTARCGWKGKKDAHGKITQVMVFGSRDDMVAEGRNYDADINKIRGGTSPYDPQAHNGIELWEAMRYVMYTSEPTQLQDNVWALLNGGQVTIDPQIFSEIPASYQYAIAAAPATGMQPMVIKLAPVKGYVKVGDVKFQNTTRTPAGEVKIIKKNSDNLPLAGAQLAILDENNVMICQWTSTDDGNPYVFRPNLAGTYVLRELAPPDGYKLADDIVFTVSNDGSVSENGVVMENKTIELKNEPVALQIKIIKVDEKDQALSGAVLALYDEGGNEIDRWSTTGSEHSCTISKAGSYTIKELEAPLGYLKADDVKVVVEPDGSVIQGTTVLKNKPVKIVNTPGGGPPPPPPPPPPGDDEWLFYITKAAHRTTQAYSSNALLSGMKVELTPLASYTSATEYSVDAALSTIKDTVIYENQPITLKRGVTYLFKEIAPPAGYRINTAKLFIKDGKVIDQIGNFGYAIKTDTGDITQVYLDALNLNYAIDRKYASLDELKSMHPIALNGLKALVDTGSNEQVYVYVVGSGWTATTDGSTQDPLAAPGTDSLSLLLLDKPVCSLEVSKVVDCSSVDATNSSYITSGEMSAVDYSFVLRIDPNVRENLTAGMRLQGYKQGPNKTPESVFITVGEDSEFTLKDTEKLVLHEVLPLGTSYTVKEVPDLSHSSASRVNRMVNDSVQETVTSNEVSKVVLAEGKYSENFINTPLVGIGVTKEVISQPDVVIDVNKQYPFVLQVPYHEYYEKEGLKVVKFDSGGAQVGVFPLVFNQGEPQTTFNFTLAKDEKITLDGLLLGTDCFVQETGNNTGYFSEYSVREASLNGTEYTSPGSNEPFKLTEKTTYFDFTNTKVVSRFEISKTLVNESIGANEPGSGGAVSGEAILQNATKLRDFEFIVEIQPDGEELKVGSVVTCKRVKSYRNPLDPTEPAITQELGDVPLVVGAQNIVKIGVYDPTSVIELIQSPSVALGTKITVSEKKENGYRANVETRAQGLVVDNEEVLSTTVNLDDALGESIKFTNTTSIQVRVIKKDGNGDPLAGATMALFDGAGDKVDEWVTTADPQPHVSHIKKTGTYTIKELAAPAGYACAEDVIIEVKSDGSITQDNVVIPNNTISVIDEKDWPLTITKTIKKMNEPYKFLSGMQVRLTPLSRFDGPWDYDIDPYLTPIEETINTEDQEIRLMCDVVYMLEEIKAPKGSIANKGKLFLKDGAVVGEIDDFLYSVKHSANTLYTGTIEKSLTNDQAYVEMLNYRYTANRSFSNYNELVKAFPLAFDGLKAYVYSAVGTNPMGSYIYKTGIGWIPLTKESQAYNPAEGARPLGLLVGNEPYPGSLEISKWVDFGRLEGSIDSGSYVESALIKEIDFQFNLHIDPNELVGLRTGDIYNAVIKDQRDQVVQYLTVVVGQDNHFSLKHGHKLVIDRKLPQGTSYTVSELSYSAYEFAGKVEHEINDYHQDTVYAMEVHRVIAEEGKYSEIFLNTPLVDIEVTKDVVALPGFTVDPKKSFGFELRIPYNKYYEGAGLQAKKYDATGNMVETYPLVFAQDQEYAVLNFALAKDEKITVDGLLLGTECLVSETGDQPGYASTLYVSETALDGKQYGWVSYGKPIVIKESVTIFKFTNTRADIPFRIIKTLGKEDTSSAGSGPDGGAVEPGGGGLFPPGGGDDDLPGIDLPKSADSNSGTNTLNAKTTLGETSNSPLGSAAQASPGSVSISMPTAPTMGNTPPVVEKSGGGTQTTTQTVNKVQDFDFVVNIHPDDVYLFAGDLVKYSRIKQASDPNDPGAQPTTEVLETGYVTVGLEKTVRLGAYDAPSTFEYLEFGNVPARTKVTVTEKKVAGYSTEVDATADGVKLQEAITIDTDDLYGTTVVLDALGMPNISFTNKPKNEDLDFSKQVLGTIDPNRRFEFVLVIDSIPNNPNFTSFTGTVFEKNNIPLSSDKPDYADVVVGPNDSRLLQPDGTFTAQPDQEIHFFLREGDFVVIENLPYNVTYHLYEIAGADFTTMIDITKTVIIPGQSTGESSEFTLPPTTKVTNKRIASNTYDDKLDQKTSIRFENTVSHYILPESGGMGDVGIRVVGGALILGVGTFALTVSLRRRAKV